MMTTNERNYDSKEILTAQFCAIFTNSSYPRFLPSLSQEKAFNSSRKFCPTKYRSSKDTY